MDDQRKDHPDFKKTPKKNSPKQLQPHNVSIHDEENTDSTNKRGDLLFINKLRIVSQGAERIPQREQRNRRASIS